MEVLRRVPPSHHGGHALPNYIDRGELRAATSDEGLGLGPRRRSGPPAGGHGTPPPCPPARGCLGKWSASRARSCVGEHSFGRNRVRARTASAELVKVDGDHRRPSGAGDWGGRGQEQSSYPRTLESPRRRRPLPRRTLAAFPRLSGTPVAFPPPGRRPLGGAFMHPSSTPPADPTPVPADPPDGPNAETPVTAGEGGRRRKVTFAKDAAGFLTELRRRVDDYFARTGEAETRLAGRCTSRRRSSWSSWPRSYVLLVFVAETWWQAVPLAVLLGVSMAAVGFNIQHDGGHHAYSRRRLGQQGGGDDARPDRRAAPTCGTGSTASTTTRTSTSTARTRTSTSAASVRFTPHRGGCGSTAGSTLPVAALRPHGLRWHLYGDFKDVIAGHDRPAPRSPGREGWDLVDLRRRARSCPSGSCWCSRCSSTRGGWCSRSTCW